MSLPKEPRQLMINLMYLVLTAMLALNVSSEILHAFKTINKSIVNSNGLINNKNLQTYMSFDANQAIPAQTARVKPFNDRAKAVKIKADEMHAYFENWKNQIVTQSGGKDSKDTTEIKRADDIDASTLLLVERGGGNQVKQKITEFRDFLLAQVDDAGMKERLEKELPASIAAMEKTDNNPQGDWATGNFYNMPVMAAVTLFSKMQNDIRSSEAIVIDHLFSRSQSVPYKFDAVRAIATPKTSYVLQGQPVEAEILLAAYNTNVNPRITASTGSVAVKQGVGSWKGTASGLGLQTVRGTVSVDMGSEGMKNETFTFQYMVGTAGASVQLDKMNVFYVGVPNPITVTAAGYSLEDVSISIPGADVSANGLGKYNVTVPASLISKTVEASINAKDASGPKSVGKMAIRVKRIPDPQARVAGKPGGGMPAASFRVQDGVIAVLENFDFEAKFRVTGFTFSMAPKRGEYVGPFTVAGPQFRANKDVEAAMARAKPGDRIFIEEIRGVGPDNTQRRLNDIIFLLN
jgi:gliding motility-associated protein GldM